MENMWKMGLFVRKSGLKWNKKIFVKLSKFVDKQCIGKHWFNIKNNGIIFMHLFPLWGGEKYNGGATKIIGTLFDLLNCKENEGLMKRLGIRIT